MKWIDLIFNATVGVLGEYKDTSVDLARIRMTRHYLEFVKMLRQQILYCIAAIIGTLMVVNLLAILEVSILLSNSFRPLEKALLAITVGTTGLGAAFFMILQLFSQERWMRRTGADRLVADAVKNRPR